LIKKSDLEILKKKNIFQNKEESFSKIQQKNASSPQKMKKRKNHNKKAHIYNGTHDMRK
jgi:hypothetical protein